MPRHIIFDLDGTLIDSSPGILATFKIVLERHGIEPQVALEHGIIGPPLAQTLASLTGNDNPSYLAPLITAFKEIYDHEGIVATPAYPGIDSLLLNLHNRGIKLHIATNKRIHPTRLLVSRLGWREYFTSLRALDFYAPPLPNKATLLRKMLVDLQIEQTCCDYVGDKNDDGAAADHNGLCFHLALWGYGDFSPATTPAHWHPASSPATLEEQLLG